MEKQKEQIVEAIDHAKADLAGLSKNIHDNPELGFEEVKAAGFISDVLEKHGFQVQKGYGGLSTSFRADAKGKEGGPTIAFLAEYDALKGVGHGCGHNVIATCASGAFASLAKIFVEMGIAGEVWIIGTPAEEGGAGKAIMLERGGFDGVDFALMIHPT